MFESQYKPKAWTLYQAKPIIDSFLHKFVRVRIERGLEVQGWLLAYSENDQEDHGPQILILKDGFGRRHIVRGSWLSLSELRLHR